MKLYLRGWVAVCVLSALSAPASMVVYEGFDIPAGGDALSGASGATSSGWTSNWSDVNNAVVAGSLNYTSGGQALPTVGGAAQLDVAHGGSFRSFTPAYTTATGTYWISFLAKVPSDSSSYAGLSLYNNPYNELVFLGELSANSSWGARTYGTGSTYGDTALAVTNTAFYVVRVDFNISGTLDDVRVWINPILGGSTPDNATATLALLGTDLSGNANAADFSMLRLQQGVAGVPGPHTLRQSWLEG